MISDTDFTIKDPSFVRAACRGLRHEVVSASEVDEIVAECQAERALCLACSDACIVVGLQPGAEELELFVWLAVAFQHGAYERQVAALQHIARELDARTIAFRSRRRGWARRLGPEWQRRGSDEFVRQVHGR
jgi:hypothetical protein